jgi:hypothetical protein
MKVFKIIAISIFSVVVLFLATLAIHIYMVTPAKTVKSDNRVRQLSRIDFTQDIDSAEAEKIRGFVAGLDGIESTYFNVPDDVLVYTYTVGKQNSENVFNKVMAFGNYNAQRYIVAAAQANNGCPVGAEEKSFTGKFTSYLSHMFN